MHPAYLGHAFLFFISISIDKLLLEENSDMSGRLIFLLKIAFKSLATPICDIASALFGVNDMSNIVSVNVSK